MAYESCKKLNVRTKLRTLFKDLIRYLYYPFDIDVAHLLEGCIT